MGQAMAEIERCIESQRIEDLIEARIEGEREAQIESQRIEDLIEARIEDQA